MDNIDLYLSTLQRLNQIKYPSPIPIAKEILDYTKGNNSLIDSIINRLSKDEPWEYIKESAEFCGYSFKISPSVLIPRVETEQLVTTVVSRLAKEKQSVQIIDTGTGSGAIILSIEKLLQNKNHIYIGTDISLEAIKIAESNKTDSNVTFINANLLDSPKIKENIPTYLVANLPYIPTEDIQLLQNSVKDYEPRIALDGGKDGLILYKELLHQIQEKNIDLKYAIFEFDPNTEENLITLMNGYPQYSYNISKDIYGQNRFLEIERRPEI